MPLFYASLQDIGYTPVQPAHGQAAQVADWQPAMLA
jgi:hypothetical protein